MLGLARLELMRWHFFQIIRKKIVILILVLNELDFDKYLKIHFEITKLINKIFEQVPC